MIPGKRRLVWVVDDSPLEAEHAARCLASAYDVRVFLDGGIALEALASEPAPDVLVLDWIMPGVTGIDVCHFMRSGPADGTLRHVAILLLTAHQRTEQIVEGLSAGANDFLSKPYAEAELLARLRALIRSKELIERVERADAAVLELLKHAPDALVAVDGSGAVTFANAQAERVFGGPASELVGRRLEDLVPSMSLANLMATTGGNTTGGNTTGGNTTGGNTTGGNTTGGNTVGSKGSDASPRPLRDVVLGGRTYAPSASVLHAGDAPSVVRADDVSNIVLSLRDVTEQRLVESRRLDLYSIVAHDLRSPLNSLYLRNEILMHEATSRGALDFVSGLKKSQKNIRSLIALINDFLEVARYEGGNMPTETERVDLPELVSQAIDDFGPIASSSQVSFSWCAPPEPVEILGDRRRLAQVLSNLLSNAIKFTPPGGTVTVVVEREGDRVTTSVRDTGRGIAADLIPTLFQRYSRPQSVHPEVEGTGLGLMIVRDIVEALGGSVHVTSVPNEGSTFSFSLPTAPVPTAPADEPGGAGAPSSPRFQGAA